MTAVPFRPNSSQVQGGLSFFVQFQNLKSITISLQREVQGNSTSLPHQNGTAESPPRIPCCPTLDVRVEKSSHAAPHSSESSLLGLSHTRVVFSLNFRSTKVKGRPNTTDKYLKSSAFRISKSKCDIGSLMACMRPRVNVPPNQPRQGQKLQGAC